MLRGVNVGGHNMLPMKELRELLSELGYRNVRTYIQSGNYVFRSEETNADLLAENVVSGIERSFGFKPEALALTLEQLDAAIEQCPYPGRIDASGVHLFFLPQLAADTDLVALEVLRKETEAFSLTERVFYLSAPDGIGRSRLAAEVERHMPASLTARNLRSVSRITELARTVSQEH